MPLDKRKEREKTDADLLAGRGRRAPREKGKGKKGWMNDVARPTPAWGGGGGKKKEGEWLG